MCYLIKLGASVYLSALYLKLHLIISGKAGAQPLPALKEGRESKGEREEKRKKEQGRKNRKERGKEERDREEISPSWP